MAEVTAWQSRPLEPMYPVVFVDALRVKIREDAVVHNKAIYLALAILLDGTRDILGLDREHRRGEVLDEGLQRPEDARRGRYPDRGHRRSEGHGRGAGRGIPGHYAEDVHRAPDPQLAGLRQLEGPQGVGHGHQADLLGRQRRGRRGRARCLRAGAMGPDFPHGRGSLAQGLGQGVSVLRVPRGPFARSCIQRMPARASTRGCARSSRRAGTSPATMRPPSGSGWRCATSLPIGGALLTTEERDEPIRHLLRRAIHQAGRVRSPPPFPTTLVVRASQGRPPAAVEKSSEPPHTQKFRHSHPIRHAVRRHPIR